MAIHRLKPGTEQRIQEQAQEIENRYYPSNGVFHILDVGGSWCPLRVATHVVDIEAWSDRRVDHYRGTVPEQFTRSTWLIHDACDTPWPYEDNAFDYVWCCQVVEDVRDPIGLCREMQRVGRAGFISTVHRSYESTVVQADGVVGYHHHRWLVEMLGDALTFTWKSPILQVNPAFRPERSLDWLLHFEWVDDFAVHERRVGGDDGQRIELAGYLTRWDEEKSNG